ncbi:MAG: MarR family winged helix-turn-helix transcriptional regulator [Sandaracinaceae bacterium]|nr:MarR family winged helix-turn-helix transcriptional regulator [Sandaracinaceae bacterium]
MPRRRSIQHLQALQAESLGFLLVRAGQRWSERVLAAVHAEAGASVVREAHTRLFPHLLVEGGIRITDLAHALGVTKQAVQPLVAELTELGMVRIETDPLDARARRVHLTDHGLAAMVHGTGVLLRVEAEVAPQLTARELAQLKRLLGKLLPILERPTSPATRPRAARPAATASRARRAPGRRG